MRTLLHSSDAGTSPWLSLRLDLGWRATQGARGDY